MAKEILEIGNIIGLETLSDYKLFAEREKRPNETILVALKRYAKELESGVQYGA
jgi:hypothetical protein